MVENALRNLPAVSDVLAQPAIAALLAGGYRQDIITAAVRERIAEARAAVASGAAPPAAEEVAQDVAKATQQSEADWPVHVLNATGVILHTNLGRAPLSRESIRAAAAASEGYSTLELDLEDGKRGSRYGAVARLLRRLTGAEDAIAVNNNAGAMLLGLAAVAAGREVIVLAWRGKRDRRRLPDTGRARAERRKAGGGGDGQSHLRSGLRARRH